MKPAQPLMELWPDIFLIRGVEGSAHTYLIRGTERTVLIDPGLEENFPTLAGRLRELGLSVEQVDLVVNTHEHFDHIGANRFFQGHSLVAAHRLAAAKMVMADDYVTFYLSGEPQATPLRVHLWLESNTVLDLGCYSLKVLHTPGHTSGSICLLETSRKLLFSGDTVFARGTLPVIGESGSVGDYINSLTRLEGFQLAALLPGHGPLSEAAQDDIRRALENAQVLLSREMRLDLVRLGGEPPGWGGVAGAGGADAWLLSE